MRGDCSGTDRLLLTASSVSGLFTISHPTHTPHPLIHLTSNQSFQSCSPPLHACPVCASQQPASSRTKVCFFLFSTKNYPPLSRCWLFLHLFIVQVLHLNRRYQSPSFKYFNKVTSHFFTFFLQDHFFVVI